MTDPEEIEERLCSCGAGHGSLEGHLDWCLWVDAMRVARKLSPAQREHLIAIESWEGAPDGPLCTIDVDGRPRRALERKGLLTCEFDLRLSDLGRSVAALLAQTDTGGRDAG